MIGIREYVSDQLSLSSAPDLDDCIHVMAFRVFSTASVLFSDPGSAPVVLLVLPFHCFLLNLQFSAASRFRCQILFFVVSVVLNVGV